MIWVVAIALIMQTIGINLTVFLAGSAALLVGTRSFRLWPLSAISTAPLGRELRQLRSLPNHLKQAWRPATQPRRTIAFVNASNLAIQGTGHFI